MKEKSVLTISRKWQQPMVLVRIDVEGIEISIDLIDYVEALISEIGSIAFVFKKETFAQQLKAANERVISGLKEESAKAI